MDSVLLVENQIDDGQKLLERLRYEKVPVRAACWMKPLDEDRWTLCISTALVEDKGLAAAYSAVYRVLRSLDNVWITDSDIRLVGEKHPITAELLDILQRYPGKSPTRSRRTSLGGLPTEEVYVYPPTPSMDPTSVERRRLRHPVDQIARPEDILLTEREKAVRDQIVSTGVTHEEAERWIRRQRASVPSRPPIPAGTLVKAWIAAFWGDNPEVDLDPLLMVEAPNGARGLVMKNDTDPAQ
jgi:hypothetical protein